MHVRNTVRRFQRLTAGLVCTIALLAGCGTQRQEQPDPAPPEAGQIKAYPAEPVAEEEDAFSMLETQMALGEQGEPYTFRFAYRPDGQAVELALLDGNGMVIQQLDITTPYLQSNPELAEDTLLRDGNFVDLNFDGYLDFRCKYGQMGRAVVYAGWVWNPDAGQFEPTNLTEIVNMWLEQRDHTIRGGFTGAGGGSMSIYRYEDRRFVETNRLDIWYEPFFTDSETGELLANYWVEKETKTGFQEYRFFHGEPVEVWPEIVAHTPEGRQQIQEHFFGKDSIWFPKQ